MAWSLRQHVVEPRLHALQRLVGALHRALVRRGDPLQPRRLALRGVVGLLQRGHLRVDAVELLLEDLALRDRLLGALQLIVEQLLVVLHFAELRLELGACASARR